VTAWTAEDASGHIRQSGQTGATRAYSRAPSKRLRRQISRRVVVGIIAAPLLAFFMYQLVDAASRRADVGETLTERSGVELTVTSPQTYTADGAPLVAAGEKLHQVVVAVNNPTDKVMSSSDFTITATVDGMAVEPVYPTSGPTEQLIEPNVQLNLPFLFKVKDGTTGPLQITVRSSDREPVYFNGTV
jgi:hypothetical protein